MEEVSCLRCSSFAIPLDHRKQYVCVRNDQLPAIGVTNDKLVSNCLKYNSEFKCA